MLFNVLMIVLAMIVASCLISTMTLFMGGGQAGVDLRALMLLQLVSIPLSILSVLAAVVLTQSKLNRPLNAKRLYAAVPQWMVFGFIMLFLLVGSGEIVFLIVTKTTNTVVEWTAHAPLVSMFTCSLAICVLYACAGLLSGRPDPRSGRWSQ